MHALQPRDAAGRVHFCSCFLQSVVEGEIDLQLIFFSDDACFHLQGYINTQNNRYWISQNPYLTKEVPPHPVQVDVCCAASARWIVVLGVLNETIHCERYLRLKRQHFQHLLRSVNCNYFIPRVIGRQACWFIVKIRRRLAAGSAPGAVELVNKVKILSAVYKHEWGEDECI
jgi:hypothetical protein